MCKMFLTGDGAPAGHQLGVSMTKEEVYQKYIVENLSRKDCAAFFNVTERTFTRRLSEFQIKKDTKKRYENICKTTKEHYGVSSSFASPKIRNKCIKTMQERYGVEYTAQSDLLQQKMQKTMSERYGKKNYVETNEFQDKSSNTCLKKHGVKWPCQYKQCIEALENAVGHSKPEQEFASILNRNNIKYEQEFPIRDFKYDFKVDNYLLEINPSGTHNSTFGLFGKEPKNKMYHFTKHSVAKEFGFHCVHIFDWDDKEKIVSLFLTKKERVYARNCEIKEVNRTEAVQFILENHLQGYAKDYIRIGLYQKDTNELLSIMTFDKPRYNTHYEHELVRYCTKKDITVIGGAEKLMNYFINNYKPLNIISYCDLSKFDGEVYRKLDFKALNKPKPSKHWYNLKTGQHITDNLLRQKGFDQLFKANYGKGMSNESLMLNAGFVEIYDCGQLAYIWNKNNS